MYNKRKIDKKSLLKTFINQNKNKGFIVETERKSKGDYHYFEVRKYTKLDPNSQKILNEKVFFDAPGENILSDYLIEKHINIIKSI